MIVDIFDGLAPSHAIEDEPGITVAVDWPKGDSVRAVMVGTFLGRAHFTCTVGGHVWVEEAVPSGTCDLNIGGGLRCGRPWGHAAFCAVDCGLAAANIPLIILALLLAPLAAGNIFRFLAGHLPTNPAVTVALMCAVSLAGFLAARGRSWIRAAVR